MTRTSTLIVRAEPSRSTSPSCSTRSTLACVFGLMSPTSSRKIVPLSACSNLPICFSVAPVNDALLVAEQLGLDQLLGNRRAVDLDEPLACCAGCCGGSRARPAPCRRRSRRGCSTVALVGAARLTCVHDLAQRRALADHLVPRLDARACSVRFSSLQPRLARARSRSATSTQLARERLLDEVERAELGRLDARCSTVPCAEMITTGSASFIALSRLSTSSPSMPRHLDVEEDEVGRSRSTSVSPSGPVAAARHVVALVLEDHPHRSRIAARRRRRGCVAFMARESSAIVDA